MTPRSFAVVVPDRSVAFRLASWHDGLVRLGVVVPPFVVADFGTVLSCPKDRFSLAPDAVDAPLETAPRHDALRRAYRALVGEVAAHPSIERLAALAPADELVVACAAHILGFVAAELRRGGGRDASPARREAPADSADRDARAVEVLVEGRLRVLTVLDALPLHAVELWQRIGDGGAPLGASLVDLLTALGDPRAEDIATFSLELLPKVAEMRARGDADLGPIDGYGGLSRRGGVDNLVPSELASDDAELERKFLEGELLYYLRERSSETKRRTRHLLIDASASMRGERSTFSRATAITLAKRLAKQKENVTLRFFDARLYEPRIVKNGKVPVLHALSFHGERGRYPARVFEELRAELALHGASRDETAVHLFTHGAFRVPEALVVAVKERAQLYAVFFLPSTGKCEGAFFDAFDGYWTVDAQGLLDAATRRQRAQEILMGDHSDGRARPSRGSRSAAGERR
jgi:hypothetical protein